MACFIIQKGIGADIQDTLAFYSHSNFLLKFHEICAPLNILIPLKTTEFEGETCYTKMP